jgi:hypothetical protein
MQDSLIIDNGITLAEVKERAQNLYEYLNDEGCYVKANTVALLLSAIEKLENKTDVVR